MKSLLIPSLLALGVTAAAIAQEVKYNGPGQADSSAPAAAKSATATPTGANPAAVAPAAAPAPAAPAPTFTEAQVLETIGWWMGKNVQAETFAFTKDQIDSVSKGFTQALEGKGSPFDPRAIGPQVEAFIRGKQEAFIAKLKQKGMDETVAFMTEIKKKPGVQTLSDGLAYEVITPGEGPAPKPTDTVKVNYRGTLVNGTEFDNSYKRNTPVEYPLDQMIPGWTEGIQKISKGGKIRLYVPPQLAYGDEGRDTIPPASTLIFEIELLDIKPTPAAPATPATPTPAPASTGK